MNTPLSAPTDPSRLNRAWRLLSRSNQALIRIADESNLLQEICRICIDEGGYRMAVVAFAEKDRAKSWRSLAYSGGEGPFARPQRIAWSEDNDYGRGLGALALRTGRPAISRDIPGDPACAPWREEALQRGYRSVIALPLLADGLAFGVLALFSSEGDVFDSDEVAVLSELASNLAFGIVASRNRAEHQHLEKERLTNLHFLASMDRINVALQGTNDLEQLMGSVLEVVLSIFDCDRAWLVYPCEIEAPSWCATMERTRPEYPGSSSDGGEEPMHPEIRRVYRAVLSSDVPVAFGPGSSHPLPAASFIQKFRIQSMLGAAIYPPTDKPYMFGLHQCSRPREWTAEEHTLFQAIGRRLADRLSSLLAYRTLRENEHHLRDSLARVERLVHSNIIGVFYWTMDGGIEEANDGMLQLLGYSRDDLDAGMLNWKAMTPPEYAAIDAWACEQLKVGQGSGPFEKEYIRKDGTRIPVLVGCALFEGSQTHGVAFVLDLSARKQAEAEREARNVAEAANRAKSEFLANMSHEIRTPMNGIIGMSRLALGSGLNPRQHHYVDNIHRSAQLLVGIIDDVLDFSKIEAGKLKIDSTAFDLGDVMDNLANVVGLQAAQKGLELVFLQPAQLPTHLTGDPLRLGQVLINLTNNAVKFTERGEVTVGVELVERTASAVQLRFGVRDTGLGMSAEQQQRLFQPFSQGDASTSRRYGGSGLGLAICHRLVGLMGGTIQTDSTAGHGSYFQFSLPFGLGIDNSARPVETAPGPLTGAHVLVVDDNPAAREAIAGMCRAVGLATQAAASGRDALDAVARAATAGNRFDLVLLDWRMPDMNGAECARQIQRSGGQRSPRTVLMFADFCRQEALHNLSMHGVAVSSVLAKPVTPSTLFDACATAMGIAARRNVRSLQREETLHDREARLAGAQILLAEDNLINQELAVELLRGAGIEITVVGDGRQALDILEKRRFDGVLMDCQMPIMDGYAATRELRRRPGFKDLPVIAMTANAMAGDREKALDAGMNDHIAKPISVDELFAKLALWLRPATLAGSATPSPPAAYGLPPLEGIDLDVGRAGTAGNEVLYRRILRMFADDHGDFTARFRGVHASKDSVSARRMVHDLTSVAGTIGARQVQASAAALEQACVRLADDREIGELLEAVDRALCPVIAGLRALG